MATPEEIGLFFTTATGVVLFTGAAFFGLVRPASPAARGLAVYFAFLGAQQLTAYAAFLPGAGGAWPFQARLFQGLVVAGNLASVAFYLFFPALPRRRAEWAWLALGAALLVAPVVAWFGLRGEAYALLPGGPRPTVLGGFLAQAAALSAVPLVVSCLLRLDALRASRSEGERLLLFGLEMPTFATVGFFAAWPVLWALGVYPRPWPSGMERWLGDPGGLGVAVHLGIWFVAFPALLLWWARRHGPRQPLLAVAYGALVVAPLALLNGFYFLGALLSVVLTLYAAMRHGAVGVARVPTAAALVLSAVAGLGVFLAVVATALNAAGDSSLALAVGVGLGLLLGGITAASVLPRAQALALLGDLTPAPALRAAPPGDGLVAGRYRVLRNLGRGGAGAARLCRDERVDRDVVLKVLHAGGSAERLQAVLREARAVGRIRHPNVITLYDVLEAEGDAVIVMEHAEGGALRERLARGALSGEEFDRVARGLLRALAAVHAAGVLHRDVKPANVLLDADGEPRLADFGIAKLPGVETTVGRLREGEAVGTFRYMSPEQARGRPATQRSDLFSAGATLYEAWSGRAYLATGDGETGLGLQLRAASPGPFDRAVEPPALREWFARLLDPDPGARFSSAAEALAAFEAARG